MNILLFHQYFLSASEPGGSRWGQLTRFFTEDPKVKINVVSGGIHYNTGKSLTGGKAYATEQVSPQIRVYRTWTYSGYNVNFVGRLIGYLSFMGSAFFRGLFLPRPDLIICSSPPLFIGVPCLLVSFFKRVPYVLEIRDLWPDSAIAAGVVTNRQLLAILYWLESLLYRRAEKIVVLTPAFKSDIEKRFPRLASRIEIITNSADFDLIPAVLNGKKIRSERGWDGKKVFAYFGAHGVANDLDQVIDVASSLSDRSDIQFVLVGDGMKKAELKSRVSSLGLKNVAFIDSVAKEDVFHYIDASDVCMATLKKSDVFRTVYPNKVFDYMACKKPSLVTIDGITRDLLESSNSGIYAEPENKSAFTAAVKKLVDTDPTDLKKMGESGYRRVREEFDREVLAKRYLKILTELFNHF